MTELDFHLPKENISCTNCGVRAKFHCFRCGKPLCGRCATREKKDTLSNLVSFAGLCRECAEKRQEKFKEGSLNILSEAIKECHKE